MAGAMHPTGRAILVLGDEESLAEALVSRLEQGRPQRRARAIRELHHAVPTVNVLSPADLVAQELAAQCLAAGAEPVRRVRSGIRLDDAFRLLLGAGLGLLAALLVEAGSSMLAVHDDLLNALYFSTRAVATVAAAPGAARAPAWFKLVSTLDTIAAVLLLAVFTAALVRRLSRPRLTALFGARAAPAFRHVLLVGFGQVGFRLARRLRRTGIPVLAVERDPDAPCLRLARDAGIPVSIGRRKDRATLELLGGEHRPLEPLILATAPTRQARKGGPHASTSLAARGRHAGALTRGHRLRPPPPGSITTGGVSSTALGTSAAQAMSCGSSSAAGRGRLRR
jgi:hypothetical protein